MDCHSPSSDKWQSSGDLLKTRCRKSTLASAGRVPFSSFLSAFQSTAQTWEHAPRGALGRQGGVFGGSTREGCAHSPGSYSTTSSPCWS